MVHNRTKTVLEAARTAAAAAHLQLQDGKAAEQKKSTEQLRTQDIEDCAVLRLPFDEKKERLLQLAVSQRQASVWTCISLMLRHQSVHPNYPLMTRKRHTLCITLSRIAISALPAGAPGSDGWPPHRLREFERNGQCTGCCLGVQSPGHRAVAGGYTMLVGSFASLQRAAWDSVAFTYKPWYLQAELRHWRSKMASSSREWASTNSALRTEATATRRHCRQLRFATACFQAQEALSLKHLCIQRCHTDDLPFTMPTSNCATRPMRVTDGFRLTTRSLRTQL